MIKVHGQNTQISSIGSNFIWPCFKGIFLYLKFKYKVSMSESRNFPIFPPGGMGWGGGGGGQGSMLFVNLHDHWHADLLSLLFCKNKIFAL